MRPVCIGLFALTLLLAWPCNTLADGMAASQATLDWAGVTITTTGSLVITEVQFEFGLADSFAFTTGTSGSGSSSDSKNSSTNPQDWLNTSASSAFSTSLGGAASQASTANAFLTSSSQASETGQPFSVNASSSSPFLELILALNGTGAGSVTFVVPYTLSAECNISGPSNVDNETSASASVLLFVVPGMLPTATDTVSCQNNSGSVKNGDLIFSIDDISINPLFGGVGVTVFDTVETGASARVPEPSTPLLLGFGLLGLAGVSLRKSLRSTSAEHRFQRRTSYPLFSTAI